MTFILAHYGPGDPLMELLQEAYWDEELRERVRHSLGLDRPFIVQYGEFLGRLMQGQLGYSILSGQRSINVMLAKAWPKSIQLGLVGMFFWFVSGTVLGIIAARFHNRTIDYIIVSTTVAVSTIPTFVLAPMLMIVFILKLGWIESSIGWEGIFSQKIILPMMLIGFTGTAGLVRQWRSSILETISQDYVRTARAKGLTERLIIVRHVLRNAFTPILTITAASLGGFITGSIFVEQIFNIHGFGWLVWQGIIGLDYPVLMITTLFSAAIILFMNLVVDILYGVVDPRVRVGERARR